MSDFDELMKSIAKSVYPGKSEQWHAGYREAIRQMQEFRRREVADMDKAAEMLNASKTALWWDAYLLSMATAKSLPTKN